MAAATVATGILFVTGGCSFGQAARPAVNSSTAVTASALLQPVSTSSSAADGGLTWAVRGMPAALSVVLTNHSNATCTVPDSVLGSIAVTTISQHGAAIAPVTAQVSFDESVSTYLAAHQRPLAPGASVGLPVHEVPGGPTGTQLETVRWSPDGPSGDYLYPVDNAAPLALTISYQQPVMARSAIPTCVAAAAATPRTPIATRNDLDRLRWWPALVVLAALGLALVVVGAIVRRRAYRVGRVATAVVIAGCLVAAGISGAPTASATITVDPGAAGAYGPCSKVFAGPGGDPAGIVPALDAAGISVTIQDSGGDQNHEITAGPGSSIILWNPSDRHPYAGDGGNADPCTTLYHEMYHAYQDSHGGHDHSDCWSDGPNGTETNSNIPVNEVLATRAQNLLRSALGMPQRDYYGDTPLPTGACLPPPEKPAQPGCTGKGCGSSNGDPHMSTFDGVRFDFQAAGEFIATDDPADDFEVQVRQQPLPHSDTVTVNTAIALSVAGDRVEVDKGTVGMTLLVGGRIADAATTTLPHGGRISAATVGTGPMILIHWPDGSIAYINQIGPWGLRMQLAPAAIHAGHLRGLLGNFDGNTQDDLVTRTGTAIGTASFTTLYPGFANSWRITDAQSLFTYPPSTNTTTYTDLALPHAPPAPGPLHDDAAVEAVCRQAGITEAVDLAACTLDVGNTGDPVFAAAADGATAANPAGTTRSAPSVGTTISTTEPSTPTGPAAASMGVIQIEGRP